MSLIITDIICMCIIIITSIHVSPAVSYNSQQYKCAGGSRLEKDIRPITSCATYSQRCCSTTSGKENGGL